MEKLITSMNNLNKALKALKYSIEGTSDMFNHFYSKIEVENKTIGFVAFDKHEITWLYVDPKFFGNGYGRRLLDFVIDKALKPIKVTVLNNNLRAISLYKSNGFKIISKSKGKIPLTEVEATIYKMEKII